MIDETHDSSIDGSSPAMPVDMIKVMRLRRAIAAGTYPIDAAAIAEEMVEADLPRTATETK